MSELVRMFRDTISTYKDPNMRNEKVADVGYSTGFPNFDMRNATVVHVKNQERNLNYKYYQIGIADGNITMLIGRSGCGKSTLALQMAANIIRPFPTGCIFSDEIESGMQDSRKQILTKFMGDELRERVITRNTGINTENVYERIKLIHDLRMKNSDKFLYNTGYLDYKGDPILKMEPCVYIIDSWALLRPRGLTEEETLSGQMSTTSSVKANTETLRRIIPMLKAANINLFIINHILQDVKINQFDTRPTQNRFLKSGERCPGGETIMYLISNLLKLYDENVKGEFGIDGSNVVRCELAKSRTNKAGKTTYFFFDQYNGYDPDLSLYITLHKEKLITAAGSWMYFNGHPEVKFQQKSFKEKVTTDPEFRKLFMQVSYEYLSKLADEEEDLDEDVSKSNKDNLNEFYNLVDYKIHA